MKFVTNTLVCLKCNTTLQAPSVDREIAVCKCRNRAWIQKRPDGPNLWAYGALDSLAIDRHKVKAEQE